MAPDPGLPDRSVKKYGWIPSLPDPRDERADVSGIEVRNEVDQRPDMPPVYDQGNLGSCTANAVAAAFEYDLSLDGVLFSTPSRLALYYFERKVAGLLGQGDTGAYGHDGFKVLRKRGVAPETFWGYDVSRFEERPSQEAVDEGWKHRLQKRYKRVEQDADSLRAVLSNDQTVAFGFTVFSSFESSTVAETGEVPVPDPRSEEVLGGHEVLIVGYEYRGGDLYFIVRNSWGEGWGDGGYCYFPAEFVLDPGYCDDFRTIARPLR